MSARRYPRRPQSVAPRPSTLAVAVNYLSYLFLFAVCSAFLYLAAPLALRQFQKGSAALEQATAVVAPRPTLAPAFQPRDTTNSQAAPLPGIAQNEATATAMYNEAIQAAQPVPNIDLSGDPDPIQLGSRVNERQRAGENAPTAEPLPEVTDQFGSKPALVAPQTTHECRHGQVWVDGKGCKNP